MKESVEYEKLLKLKCRDSLDKEGIIFNTSKSKYYFDAGTGKVLLLDAEEVPIMEALLDANINSEQFRRIITDDKVVKNIITTIEEECLFSSIQMEHFVDITPFIDEKYLKCEQLTIELTGKCNLRCKYCIYNEAFSNTRSFNNEIIDFNTAKKAIDYVYANRAPESTAITFYGGEPLLNFNVMKRCIEYCLNEYKSIKTTFSFTSNLTLLTAEMAEFFAEVPNLSIVVSLDGPAEIHNQNRVFANGTPTFQATFNGLKLLCAAIKKHNGNQQIMINTVLMPPYTSERFDRINDFFESLDFLPEGTSASATYPLSGSVPDSFIENLIKNGYNPQNDISWTSWALKKVLDKKCLPYKPNLYSTLIRKILLNINNRRLLIKPVDRYYTNGCCIPANRRLYVCTNGFYKICERIGESPYIGHVDTGIDFQRLKDKYITEYQSKSLHECSKCWAVNMCDMCYAECFDKEGINTERKAEACQLARLTVKEDLAIYYEILEKCPSLIESLNDIVVS